MGGGVGNSKRQHVEPWSQKPSMTSLACPCFCGAVLRLALNVCDCLPELLARGTSSRAPVLHPGVGGQREWWVLLGFLDARDSMEESHGRHVKDRY